MFKKSFLLFFAVIFVISTGFLSAGIDDEARIIGISYPKSYAAKKYEDKANGIFSVVFKVKLSFPSKEVLNFYDDKLKEMGWTPFCEPYYSKNNGEWEKFIMWPAAEGNILKYQLQAKWVNKDKTRMLLLVIIYYSKNLTEEEQISAKGPNNDIQNVAVQFMPFRILPPPSHGK